MPLAILRFKTALLALAVLLSLQAQSQTPASVTPLEAKALAQMIENAVLQKDPQSLDSLLDRSLLAVTINKQLGTTLTAQFGKDVRNALDRFRWGPETIGKDNIYQLIRAYEQEGAQHLVFRMFGTAGLSYHDHVLTRTRKGIRIADMYIYTTGEHLSQSLAKSMKAILVTEDLTTQFSKDINQMGEHIRNGDGESAWVAYQKLPPNIRKEKAVMMFSLKIGQLLGLTDPRYLTILTQYETAYGHEPGSGLALLDAYFLRKDWDKALLAINRLDAAVGKDPFLDFFRANIFTAQQQYAEARPLLEQLHRAMPGYQTGFLELLANTLLTGDQARAGDLIAEYKANTALDPDAMKTVLNLFDKDGGAR